MLLKAQVLGAPINRIQPSRVSNLVATLVARGGTCSNSILVMCSKNNVTVSSFSKHSVFWARLLIVEKSHSHSRAYDRATLVAQGGMCSKHHNVLVHGGG